MQTPILVLNSNYLDPIREITGLLVWSKSLGLKKMAPVKPVMANRFVINDSKVFKPFLHRKLADLQ